MNKLLIIGLDGATFDLIRPFAEEGKLPRFKEWMDGGSWGELRSVVPALTPPAWTSGFTGVNPGKHNIFDFFAFDREKKEMGLASSKDRRAPAFWEILAGAGVRTGLFNVPCSYPADEVNGFMVTGMATPYRSRGLAHPPELEEELLTDAGFRYGADASLLEKGKRGLFLKDIYDVTGNQEKRALGLLARYEPEVFMFVYDETDRVMHFFWHDSDDTHPAHDARSGFGSAMLDYFRRVEEGISGFLDVTGAGTDMMIFSDHGFGPLHRDIYVNRLLWEWGYLKVNSFAGEMARKPLWKRAVKKIVPQGARKYFRQKIKASPLANPLGFIDMENSKAFYASVSGRSVIILDEVDKEKTRAELKERLENFVDEETGIRPFRKVWYREDIYAGGSVDNAPDMVIEEDGRYAFKTEWSLGRTSVSAQYGSLKSGSHRENGVLICFGPSFEKGKKLDGCSILDVTPTILHLLGLPVGKDMDGRALVECLVTDRDPSFAEYSRDRKGMEGAGADEEAVKEKLRNLGYM